MQSIHIMMMSEENGIVGKGAHWEVYRITATDNGQTRSLIRKRSIGEKVDTNIAAFNLVFQAGLPTLKRYVKVNDDEIEAEDLNADTLKGYFVSPNTIRGCQNCVDVFLRYTKSERLTSLESEQCKEFDFSRISEITESKGFEEILHKMRLKKISIGAEGEVYNNKIKFISNLELFCRSVRKDLENATFNKIVLYSDAFFFRVNPLNGYIEYVIADFDCITSTDYLAGVSKENQKEFKTALLEFMRFFVVKEKQEEYIALLDDFMSLASQ